MSPSVWSGSGSRDPTMRMTSSPTVMYAMRYRVLPRGAVAG
jgi:hypothetical protein